MIAPWVMIRQAIERRKRMAAKLDGWRTTPAPADPNNARAALERRWNFWLPDEDRSAGWTNHCYVLQYVCEGAGATAEEAWADAKQRGVVPEGFHLPEGLTAIRQDAEEEVYAE